MHEGMTENVDDDFTTETLDPRWTRTCVGGGLLTLVDSALRFTLPSARADRYSDAQIDDYSGIQRHRYPWRPPLRLSVRAHLSHPSLDAGFAGTCGFGFWNYPFTLSASVVRLPDCVWFFGYSPPSNVLLVPGQRGWGWKAEVIHAARWGAALNVPRTAAAVGWARLTGHERSAAAAIERFSGTSSTILDGPGHPDVDLRAWHEYGIEWRATSARFFVDGALVLDAPNPPTRPLGFVAWVDNQYAVATPRGSLRFGRLAAGEQWMALDHLRIESL